LCSNYSPRKKFLSSYNHRISRILLRVTFDCFYSENASQEDVFATMEDIKSTVTAELRKIPKEAIIWCFQKWPDQCKKCLCARHCRMPYRYSSIPPFRGWFNCPSYVLNASPCFVL
jgi:hypothetical protein